MAIRFQCVTCGKTLEVPDNAAGATVRCPACQAGTQVPGGERDLAMEPILSPPAPQGYGLKSEPAHDKSREDREPCPMCGEMIAVGALKCRFCGEIFDETLRRAEKRKKSGGADDEQLTAAEIIVGLLCANIGCIISIIWMIQGKSKGTKMLLVSLLGQAIGAVIYFVIMAAGKH